MSQNVMPIRSKSAGFIIRILNVCRMSIFPTFALLPNDEIISTTLSNDEYKTRRKSSCMKSFTLLPLGKDKCDMRRQLLSDFCTSPIGEIRSDDIGFVENGPNIRPKSISFFNLTSVST